MKIKIIYYLEDLFDPIPKVEHDKVVTEDLSMLLTKINNKIQEIKSTLTDIQVVYDCKMNFNDYYEIGSYIEGWRDETPQEELDRLHNEAMKEDYIRLNKARENNAEFKLFQELAKKFNAKVTMDIKFSDRVSIRKSINEPINSLKMQKNRS